MKKLIAGWVCLIAILVFYPSQGKLETSGVNLPIYCQVVRLDMSSPRFNQENTDIKVAFGDTHAHSKLSNTATFSAGKFNLDHIFAQTLAQNAQRAREFGHHFQIASDHDEVFEIDPNAWDNLQQTAREFQQKGFCLIPGFELTLGRLVKPLPSTIHFNVFGVKEPWQARLGKDPTDSDLQDKLVRALEWFDNNPGVMFQINHPAVGSNQRKNFQTIARYKAADNCYGIELISGQPPFRTTIRDNEPYYRIALEESLCVAPVVGGDFSFPLNRANSKAVTGIYYSPDEKLKDQDDFVRAMRSRACIATEDQKFLIILMLLSSNKSVMMGNCDLNSVQDSVLLVMVLVDRSLPQVPVNVTLNQCNIIGSTRQWRTIPLTPRYLDFRQIANGAFIDLNSPPNNRLEITQKLICYPKAQILQIGAIGAPIKIKP